jgi:ubiquinone biosynthesis O-methyltransferase
MQLPRENVYGHTKKARLMRAALERMAAHRQQGLQVLDVGCGNGMALTRFLAVAGTRVLGIDTHEPSIEYARRHVEAPGVEFRVATIDALLSEERRFDAVVFADVLEHVHEPERMLAAGVQLLRPGGRVLVTVPNGFGPFEVESWLSRVPALGPASIRVIDRFVAVLNRFVFKGAWTAVVQSPDVPYNVECGHVRFFSQRRLLTVANQAGLTPVRKTGVSWLSGPYTNYLFAPSRSFCAVNTRLADILPFWMLSAWFFELTQTECDASAPHG